MLSDILQWERKVVIKRLQMFTSWRCLGSAYQSDRLGMKAGMSFPGHSGMSITSKKFLLLTLSCFTRL